MIKIALIDDDQKQINLFVNIVKEFFFNEIEIICTFNSPTEAYEKLKKHDFDILFCDVDMPVINGIALLELLSPYTFKVVMLTGHEKYAIQAIKHQVMDYIIKPPSFNNIAESIKKYKTTNSKNIPEPKSNLNLDNNLIINSHEKTVVMSFDDIVRFEASGAYTIVTYNNNKSIISSKPIKFYEQATENRGFLKIHRSHLVNLKHIKELVKHGNEGELILSNDETLTVSKIKQNEIVNLLLNK